MNSAWNEPTKLSILINYYPKRYEEKKRERESDWWKEKGRVQSSFELSAAPARQSALNDNNAQTKHIPNYMQ